LVARVANGLAELGLVPGDRVAIDLAMTVESVGVFLGVVAAGCCAVTIADSFAAPEIAVRLEIGAAKCIFTQDDVLWLGKRLPLYEKVKAAHAPRAIVLACEPPLSCTLREGDIAWEAFLSDKTELRTVGCRAATPSTVLFSSGTTGEPKAIPWDQTTPLKAAIDGHLHQDIHPGDVICWPTSLGWMMGPWLAYASLMNRGTIALHYGAPTTREFGQFVQDAGVTLLGVVPTLVSAWKASGCMAGLDWSSIRAFSSTGECSNPTDMLFLMSLAGYRPVIEYCGGTEIGGGYITGTVVQAAVPGTFSTPALGSELVVLDEGHRVASRGEVFLVPPSMGLSLELLNGDHHDVYYAGTPAGPRGETLRRHGDEIERFGNGYFRGHGRVDDTMKMGGIKVSSLQIEQAVSGVSGVRETAAVCVSPPDGGPGRLVVYVVPAGEGPTDAGTLKAEMQQAVRTRLNPLFKVHDVVIVDALPRTPSNKVMRRTLRAEYEKRMAQE
jgi:acetyl-CoA synthetase